MSDAGNARPNSNNSSRVLVTLVQADRGRGLFFPAIVVERAFPDPVEPTVPTNERDRPRGSSDGWRGAGTVAP